MAVLKLRISLFAVVYFLTFPCWAAGAIDDVPFRRVGVPSVSDRCSP